MASRKYHGSEATATVTTEGGSSITVAEFRGVNIVVQDNVDELDTADSTLRSAVKIWGRRVLCEFDIAEFDIDLIHQFLAGSGGSSTGLVDTGDPMKFDVTGKVTQHGQSTDLQAAVTGVVFPEMPIIASTSHDSWTVWNISGTGDDVTVTEV